MTDRPSTLRDFGPEGRNAEALNTAPVAQATTQERRGDWMITYTGKRFWPLDPRAEDVDFRDIGHALSMICRYGGHVRRFYSVAEHSALLARYFFDRGMMGAAHYALVHDMPEAYVGDMVRPLKRRLPQYERVEITIALAIAEKIGAGVVWDMSDIEAVHAADSRIIANEARELFRPETRAAAGWLLALEPLPNVIPLGLSPHEAEREFAKLFLLLFPELALAA